MISIKEVVYQLGYRQILTNMLNYILPFARGRRLNESTNKVWKNASGNVVTPDSSIAAHLLKNSTKLVDIVIHDGHGLFVFETNRDVVEIVEQYKISGDREFYDAYRDLLRMLHAAKRDQSMLRLREGNS